MTFESTRRLPTQEHFYIIEVDLPIITGTCEITAGNEGYGTPLSCPVQDGTSAVATKTYYFATPNAPLLDISPVYRCVNGISEQATELTPGKGLAIRGRATINFVDFTGDPNPERASTQAIKNQGTFFGKFEARNVFENKEVRIKKYRKTANVDLVNDAETSYFVGRSLSSTGKGAYSLTCADELSKVEFDQSKYPLKQDSFLRQSIDDVVTAIPVDTETDWNQVPTPYVIRIGDEFMTVLSVSNNQAANASLTVKGRGIQVGPPEYSDVLTFSRKEEHDAGDEVFICKAFSQANIADVLEDMLLNANIPSSIIPIADWYDEIALWHGSNFISTIFYESEPTNNALLKVLEPYLLDMWNDPIDREIKLSAISQWQESSMTLTEGKEIDYESISTKQLEDMRFSQAFISYDKPYLSDPDEPASFKKASLAVRSEVETEELYGDPKVKQFENSYVVDIPAADLLVQRYVQRFGFTPVQYSWMTQERFLEFKVGDVVNVISSETQGIDGLPDTNTRAQITKIQPTYSEFGREYKVDALTYQSAATSGGGNTVFTISGGADLNLFIQAGAPALPVDVTFILDGGNYLSTNAAIPAIRAGSFAAGSTITIILRDAANWQAKGGQGGDGNGQNGFDGGICYDADSIDTDIYLGGADPEGGTASGFLRAPGGGGGGGNLFSLTSGGGGGGGAGNFVGLGGQVVNNIAPSFPGGDGTIIGVGGQGGEGDGSAGDGGAGGNWGQNGFNSTNGGLGGLAGKGLVKDGATVTLFGSNATNFINGSGEAPD